MLFEIDKITEQSQRRQYKNCFYHGSKSYAQQNNLLKNEIKQQITRIGMNVVPVVPHQAPNMFSKIICDIGNKSFESINPGFTYPIFSRCTTIGNKEDKLSSSL